MTNPEIDIALLGGGGGLPFVLESIYRDSEASGLSIVTLNSTADSGGSSGGMRNDNPGMWPPGDFIKTLAASAKEPTFKGYSSARDGLGDSYGNKMFRDLFKSFRKGAERGVEDWSNPNSAALDFIARHVDAQAVAMSMLEYPSVLSMDMDGERVVEGEYAVTAHKSYDQAVGRYGFSLEEVIEEEGGSVRRLAEVTQEAKGALMQADNIVLAPSHTAGTMMQLVTPFITSFSEEERAHLSGNTTMMMGSVNPPNMRYFTAADHMRMVARASGMRPARMIIPRGSEIELGAVGDDVEVVETDEVRQRNGEIDVNNPCRDDKPNVIYPQHIGRELLDILGVELVSV